MNKELNYLAAMIAAFIDRNVRTATKYVSPGYTMRLSLVRPPDRRAKSRTFSLTLGTPNYAGREFVKACKRAGEPFPVEKVQLKFWPKKRKARG